MNAGEHGFCFYYHQALENHWIDGNRHLGIRHWVEKWKDSPLGESASQAKDNLESSHSNEDLQLRYSQIYIHFDCRH